MLQRSPYGTVNNRKGVKYISLHEDSGYGIAARRNIIALINSGIPVTWTPMIMGFEWGLGYEPFKGQSVGNEKLDAICNKPIEYDTVILHTVPEYFPLWKSLEAGKTIWGCTVWETDRIPPHWVPLLNSMDGLFVPCAWNRDVFRQCGVTVPIEVVPHILSEDILPARQDVLDIPAGIFLFYTINTWTERKALWHTIRCFLDTFTSSDPVGLLIKTTPTDFTRVRLKKFFSSTRWALRRQTVRYRKPAAIYFITENLADEEILQIHARGDCYISLCRSEGWGLGAFDAAGFGKPVIMTGYGGHLDYLTPDLSFLVDYRLIPVQDEAGRQSYQGDQHWAEPDIVHASRLMRRVFDDRKTAERMGMNLKTQLHHRFNGMAVAGKMIECIKNFHATQNRAR